MYKSFLGWEVGIKRMALLLYKEGNWKCVTQIQAGSMSGREDFGTMIKPYLKMQFISIGDPKELQDFDLILPIHHKGEPVADRVKLVSTSCLSW